MRRLLSLALIIVPISIGAQTPVRYRFTSRSSTKLDMAQFQPLIASIKAAGGDASALEKITGENVMTTSAVVSVATHDSAGGTVWTLVIDSLVQDPGELMRSMAARSGATSPTAPQPPDVYQVFVRDGGPVSFWRADFKFPIPASHVTTDLLDKMPGFGLLIPSRDIPTRIGMVKADTTADSTTKRGAPAVVTSYDTVIVAWKRSARDTVDANVTAWTSPVSGTNGPGTAGTGTYQIIYNAQQQVSEGKMVYHMTMPGNPVSPLTDNAQSVLEYNIIRVP